MSTTTIVNNEMIKFEEVSSTLMTAGDVLEKNRNLFEKAEGKAKSLLDTIDAEGMSDEIDVEINDWQVKARQALDINNKRRTPITQLLSKISSEFTSLENPLNPQKGDSYFSKLQLHRNKFAAEKERQRKAKEAEILRKQNADKERGDLKVEAESQIRTQYNKKLFSFKGYISKLLNDITLENFDESRTKIEGVKIDYPRDKFNDLTVALFAQFVQGDEVEQIITAARASLYDELSANFRENMEVDKQQAIDQLPSKKKELERIAKAGAEEAERLRQEAEKRKKIEEQRLKLEQEEKEKHDAAKLDSDKTMNQAQNLFDTAHQFAEIASTVSKVKTSYVIEVKDAAGWGAIFLFFFEKVGIKLDVETFGKKSMNQMKKEVEKIANTTSEKVDHPSVKYVEDVKAVVTK